LPGSQATNDPKNHRRNAKAEYATRARFWMANILKF
jgi:hypothetical protein